MTLEPTSGFDTSSAVVAVDSSEGLIAFDRGVAEAAVRAFSDRRHEFDIFLQGVIAHFQKTPSLNRQPLPAVHSIKWRLKDESHLVEKIERKWQHGAISPENIFTRLTDLAGIRVLHLHQKQFPVIHESVMQKVNAQEWCLAEPPVAYSWDPESRRFYEELGVATRIKESFYTSVHYLLKPRSDSVITCELQVRSLFEEIWGEIDHAVNYPAPTSVTSCRDQIRVLARLVSTGSRLADSIFGAWLDADEGRERVNGAAT